MAVGATVLVNILYFCPSFETVLARPTKPSLAIRRERERNQSWASYVFKVACDYQLLVVKEHRLLLSNKF